LALWAWRNRREVLRWIGFGKRAVPALARGSKEDVLTEARLRAFLTRDPRTRGARSVSVTVRDGVAHLAGTVTPQVHMAAVDLAERTKGIRGVQCEMRERGWSTFRGEHAHHSASVPTSVVTRVPGPRER
jgi:osmotically-inducible protein OsmY